MLKYLYCEKFDTFETRDLLKLIVAAKKYQVEDLVNACEINLKENLSTDNAINIFLVADELELKYLKSKTMEFIFKNKDLIVATPEYDNLVATNAKLVSELFINMKFNEPKKGLF